MGAKEAAAKYRRKHPDRYLMAYEIDKARRAAVMQLKYNHPAELERLIVAECERRGIPRYLPPLEPEQDGRGKWRWPD